MGSSPHTRSIAISLLNSAMENREGFSPERQGEVWTYAQGRYRLIINRAWCKGCELCTRSCPAHILELDEELKVYVTDFSRCLFCGLCEVRCPDFAIKVEKPSVLELASPGQSVEETVAERAQGGGQ